MDDRSYAHECGSNYPDADALYLFCGFSHFYISYHLASGSLYDKEVEDLVIRIALTSRELTPNHLLGNEYIQFTALAVKQANSSVYDQNTINWIPAYFRIVGMKIDLTESEFVGALSSNIINKLHIQ